MRLYLDASVLVPMLVSETGSGAVDRLIEQLSEAPLVSTFAVGKTSSAIARLVRMEKLTSADAQDRLTSFDRWIALDAALIETDPADVRLASLFVRRFEFGLRMPNAIHVATTERLGGTLVTLDTRLADAASALDIAAKIPA